MMIEITNEDATAIADFLSVLASYIENDPQGAKAIATHAKAVEASLRAKLEPEPEPEDEGPVPFFIVVDFSKKDTVSWNSVGWGANRERMAAAKKAINEGKDEAEVRANLTKAGFTIVE